MTSSSRNLGPLERQLAAALKRAQAPAAIREAILAVLVDTHNTPPDAFRAAAGPPSPRAYVSRRGRLLLKALACAATIPGELRATRRQLDAVLAAGGYRTGARTNLIALEAEELVAHYPASDTYAITDKGIDWLTEDPDAD